MVPCSSNHQQCHAQVADASCVIGVPTPVKQSGNNAPPHSVERQQHRDDSPPRGRRSSRSRSMSASPSPSPRLHRGRSVDRETPREQHHPHGGGARDDNVGTIFVGNLHRELSERRLREYFDTYGRVLSAKVRSCFFLGGSCCCALVMTDCPSAQIVINPETQVSKGFGFVKFEDARDAEDAIREADGKVCPVAWAVFCLWPTWAADDACTPDTDAGGPLPEVQLRKVQRPARALHEWQLPRPRRLWRRARRLPRGLSRRLPRWQVCSSDLPAHLACMRAAADTCWPCRCSPILVF
jgi:hypothetical protein